MMKTWQVGPYHDEWVVIVHADTRGQARAKGATVDGGDLIDMRAIRVPDLDGKLVTNETLRDAGFPETWEGEKLDAYGYIIDCGCDVCKASLREAQERRGKQELIQVIHDGLVS